ncbi:MAG: glycoside hydrolase family 92 protein [Clostridia bacterium]|nr:glycoside hydrolase family 92 protein [Clostridia bacterium]
MKDFAKYVDCFYGNGETDRFFDSGLASKWFYIKAQCGNTIPHATLPFGKMSVGPYSGGYPAGYGTHYPNSCGGIQKLGDEMTVRGFSHLHHSGVGGIGYYYNYAIVTPFERDLSEIYNYTGIANEKARPGYYACEFKGINCEFTVSKGVAYHKYAFKNKGGQIAVDFSNNGLSKVFKNRSGSVDRPKLTIVSDNLAVFTCSIYDVELYFAVKVEGVNVMNKLFVDDKYSQAKSEVIANFEKGYGVAFSFDGVEATLKLAYSTVSVERAINEINACDCTFDEAKENAYGVWNDALSKIEIETDNDELKTKFYSNLYHTMVKPMLLADESVLGVKGRIVTDISTFWDTYKTVFPLQMLLYKDLGEALVETIQKTSKTFGKVPCSLALANIYKCEQQAKALSVYTLLDAYHYGVENATIDVVEDVFKRELQRDDYLSFINTGYFERYTHILDVTDVCFNIAEVTNDSSLKNTAEALAKNWKNAYDADGLMSVNSPYYEGDRYTYSFRLQKNIGERMDLVGGKKGYEELLDSFFGFNKESVSQVREIEAFDEIESKKYHRFQGFNNECDMETAYSYIYVDNHDKLCDVVYECVNRSFGVGKSGLPGNNDSGGLTSCFVWNAIGLFPVTGSGKFLIGAPSFKKVTFKLFNGKELTVEAENLTKPYGYVESVYFNGEEIVGYEIDAEKIVNGGTLKIKMR